MYRLLKQHKFIFINLPLMLLLPVSLVLNLLPAGSIPDMTGYDRILHFLNYFIFSALLNLSLHFWNRFTFISKNHSIICIILLASLSIAIEFLQMYIPGRSFQYADIIANLVGILSGIFIGKIIIEQPKLAESKV